MPGFTPPSSAAIQRRLDVSRFAAPGPDGLSAHVWAGAGPAVLRPLALTAAWLCSGLPMLPEYNSARFVFISKAPEADDSEKVIRSPMATRPLGLNNDDSKILNSAVLRSFNEATRRDAAHAQRGFVPGRSFASNVIELDAAGRQFCLLQPHLRPCFVFTDFEAAFPSISQAWIEAVVRASAMPLGAKHFLLASFRAVLAFSSSGGQARLLFVILSGVIQGCPLAAFAFLVGFNPFFLKWRQG